jgi:hypothetical protein
MENQHVTRMLPGGDVHRAAVRLSAGHLYVMDFAQLNLNCNAADLLFSGDDAIAG